MRRCLRGLARSNTTLEEHLASPASHHLCEFYCFHCFSGRTTELSDSETRARLISILRQPSRFERLLTAAGNEPPRVRAMLGAIGQEIGIDAEQLAKLKAGLNHLSRFDFGILRGLTDAQEWQAK